MKATTRIAKRRGYVAITKVDSGLAPRPGMKREFNEATRDSYAETAFWFHDEKTPNRFTKSHAEQAGYGKRKGENLPRGSRAYRRSYTGRKERVKGHTRPMVLSGDTERDVTRSRPSVTASKNGAILRYPKARKLNYRHPKSRLRPSEEFGRITSQEATEAGTQQDKHLQAELDRRDQD